MANYLHPILAALVLGALGYLASLAMRARRDRRAAPQLLRLHARLAPWVFGFVVGTWAAGLLAMWRLHPERALARSGHFQLGLALVALLSGSALSSRWMDRAAVRSLHPWFGAAALLGAAAQVFLGLQLMR